MKERFVVVDCKFIPGKLKPGVIYRSFEYLAAIHLCACGCGSETVTPMDQGWKISGPNNAPSVTPSIGNMKMPCASHYWIKNGEVQWC